MKRNSADAGLRWHWKKMLAPACGVRYAVPDVSVFSTPMFQRCSFRARPFLRCDFFFFSASAPVTGSFVSEFKYAGEIYCRVWERGTRKVHPDQQKSLSLVRMRQDFLLTALQGAVSKLVAEPLGFKIISCATGNICRHSFLESFSLKVCWVQPTQKRCQVMMTSVYFSKILIYARQRRPL